MLSNVLNDIIVTVSPDIFHFQRKEIEKSLPTKVYFSLDDTNPQIVGIGDELKVSAATKCIELFKPNNSINGDVCKIEALIPFLKQGLLSLKKRTDLVRPRVVIKGANSLEACMCGYQYTILEKAMFIAGVRKIIFKD